MSDRVGQQLGNYRVISLIGRGGFAEVYLGEHVYLKTRAAIKVLQTRLAKEDREGFLTEARTIAHLQHDHIVSVLEFGVESNVPFLVMEYAPHGTLRRRHSRGIPLALERIVPYVKQIADALHYAHERRLIHRDVKPENMLLGGNDEVLLSDFGIALVVRSSLFQEKEEVAGTVSYMAPEQLQGKPRPASDQYGLGVVVYEWLCGDRPFLGSFTEVASQHLLTPPPPLQEKVPNISAAVEEVVRIALAKDPRQRFASVLEFATALEHVSVGAQFVAPAPSPLSNRPIVLTQSPTLLFSRVKTDDEALSSSLPASNPQQISKTVAQEQPLTVSQRPQSRRTFSLAVKTFFVVLALLVIGGSGFAYFTRLLRPVNSPPAQTKASTFQEIYDKATSGMPAIDDSLSTESIISWNSLGSCSFVGGALHADKPVFNGSEFEALCFPGSTNFTNFAYQVQMTIVKGDEGAVAFRASKRGNYVFLITPKGSYILLITSFKPDGTVSSSKSFLQGTSSAFKAGLNQANLLTVIARNNNMYLYIDKKYVAGASDTTSPSGGIGVLALGSQPDNVDVAFSNAQVWILQ